jgi:type IV secretory pathway VirD2 relaxase
MPRRNLTLPGERAFFDIVSHGRGLPMQRKFQPAQIEQIARTVRYTPEVMVKISGGGKSAKAAAAHFRYLSRREFSIETDEGERIKGAESIEALIEDWELDLDAVESRSPYRGVTGRKANKLVHNVVLSMPTGTPAERLLEASRAFAREQFALKHRYALALHTDTPHPHVHLVVKSMSEQGRRLNIRKDTLRNWRREFASDLRSQGIAANATERIVRGVNRLQKRDGVYRAMRAGRSIHMRERVESVAAELRDRIFQVEPAKARILSTRREVLRGWTHVQEALRADNKQELAREVERFVRQMPTPQTEREWLARSLQQRIRQPSRQLELAMPR